MIASYYSQKKDDNTPGITNTATNIINQNNKIVPDDFVDTNNIHVNGMTTP